MCRYAGLFDGAEQGELQSHPDGSSTSMSRAGRVVADDAVLEAGDALKLTDATGLRLSGGEAAEVIVFDLPADAG